MPGQNPVLEFITCIDNLYVRSGVRVIREKMYQASKFIMTDDLRQNDDKGMKTFIKRHFETTHISKWWSYNPGCRMYIAENCNRFIESVKRTTLTANLIKPDFQQENVAFIRKPEKSKTSEISIRKHQNYLFYHHRILYNLISS